MEKNTLAAILFAVIITLLALGIDVSPLGVTTFEGHMVSRETYEELQNLRQAEMDEISDIEDEVAGRIVAVNRWGEEAKAKIHVNVEAEINCILKEEADK